MYITTIKTTKTKTNFNNIVDTPEQTPRTRYCITIKITEPKQYNKLPPKQRAHIKQCETYIERIIALLKEYDVSDNRNYLYTEFKIPKKTGGLRTINAPITEFKESLTFTKQFLEQLKCLPHPAAYAYIPHKSIKEAIEKHQSNNSKWFLKIDLHNFFPSCNPDWLYEQIVQLYPFAYMEDRYKNYLRKIIKICSLNNGLPQGTPTSPILTNLAMVPIDYAIYETLKRFQGNHFAYTRYADDLLISCKSTFDKDVIINTIKEILKDTPLTINDKKTRYGSINGRNWNLGLMLNKDNNITLGSAKKKQLNAMLNNFLRDYKNNIIWPKEDIYTLQGQLSWLKHIEPDYTKYIIEKYNTKYDIEYKQLLKELL